MPVVLTIAVAGVVLAGLFVWFYKLEAADRRHTIFAVLVVVMVLEALLAGPAADVPIGILRPRVFRQDFRAPDAIIFAALAARVLSVRGQKVSKIALVWSAFLALYLTGVLVGLMTNLPLIDVLFQGKGTMYLIGGMVIGSGADVDKIKDTVWKLGIAVACMVPIAMVIDAAGLTLSLNTPIQRFNRLGRLSNDSITLVTLIGVVMILVEATSERRRLKVGIAGVVLLLAPVAGQQRASYLVVAGVGLALAGLVAGPTWTRRSSVTRVEIALLLAGLVGLVGAGLIITSSPETIVAPVEDAFTGEAESRSADARFTLVDQAVARIAEKPLLGWGVGIKVVREAVLSGKEVEAAAHNVLLDVGMRVGLIGLFLFLFSIWTTGRHAMTIWRRSTDNTVAGIAAAGFILVLGVLTKGMVEPALDKFRLALTLGLGSGLVMASWQRFEQIERVRRIAVDEPPAPKDVST